MATRDYTSGARQGPQVVASPSAADAGRTQVRTPRDSVLTEALGSLAQFGQQYAARKFDDEVQQSYLDGERARATGQAVDEIQSNPLMRPFVNNGWQQQDYQLAQSDLVTKASTFLAQDGRTKTPGEFQAWLKENSAPVSASINDSMGTADRAKALRSQAATEQQLIKAHASAYVKYSQEQYAQRIQAGGNAHITAYMQAVQSGDPDATTTAMQNITDFATDLLENEGLPLDLRQKSTTDYLRATISETGSTSAVTALLRSGALDGLPADQRMQIDESIQQAQRGKVTQEQLDFSDQWAQFNRRMDAGVDPPTFQEFQEMQRRALQVGKPQSWFDSANEAWYKSGQNSDVAITANALINGDISALGRTGKSLDEGLDAVTQMAFRQSGNSPLKAWATAMDVGLRYGKVPKAVQEGLSAALKGAIMNPDGQTQDQQQLLSGTLTMLGGLQTSAPDKAAVVFQGLDADTQSTMAGTLMLMQSGVQPYDALRQTVASQSKFSSLSPQAQGQQVANLTKGVGDVVKSEFTSPWYKGLFNAVIGDSSWEGNAFVQGQLSAAVSSEAQRLASLPQYAGALAGNPAGQQALIKAAAANVKNRALDIGVDAYVGGVPHSLLVPPQGASIAGIFGVPSSTPLVKEQLGALVAQETRKNVPSGYASAYSFSPVTGKLQQTVYSKDGTQAATYEVDARGIGQKYVKQFNERMQRERNGVVINVPTGDGGTQKFTLSGNGPGGMTSDEVIKFRRDLVQDEGLRLSVYKDTQGVLTGGVGQNIKALGGEFDRTLAEGSSIPADLAQRWFNDASYKALSSGKLLADQYGFSGNARVQAALGKAVYQLGDGGWGQFDKAEQAIARRDPAALEASIKASKWYQQTPKRAQAFLDAMLPELQQPWRAPGYTNGTAFGRNTL